MPSDNSKPLILPSFETKLPPEFIEGLDERGKYLYQTIDKITQVQDFLLGRAVADANTLFEVKEQTTRTNGRLLSAEADIKDIKLAAAVSASATAEAAKVAAMAVSRASEVAAAAKLAVEVAAEAKATANAATQSISKVAEDEKPAIKTVNFFIELIKNKWFWIAILAFFTFVAPWLASHAHYIVEFLKILIAG